MNDDYDNAQTDREMLKKTMPAGAGVPEPAPATDRLAPVRDLSEDEAGGWGGFQATANLISGIRGIPFSRHRVYSLHKWRAGNGFPAGQAVRLPDGRVKPCWFSKADVAMWATSHRFRNSQDRVTS